MTSNRFVERSLFHENLKNFDSEKLTKSERIEFLKACAFADIAEGIFDLGVRDAATPMGAIEALCNDLRVAASTIASSIDNHART